MDIPQVPLSTGMMPPPNGDPIGDEIKKLSSKPMPYDNKSSLDIVRSVAKRTGVDPALLYSSAFQEGMNKAIARPDEVSEAYNNAKVSTDYPVDGFYNYGLDTFSDRFPDLVKKGYLPQEFQNQFKSYPAQNEAQKVNTAAFRNNEDALTAKAAILRDLQDRVTEKAKAKGIDLDPKGLNYLTLAFYNAKEKSASKLFDEYAAAKDKDAFVDNGQTSMKGIHKNIAPRLDHMKIVNDLISQEDQSQAGLKTPIKSLLNAQADVNK